MTEDTMPTKWLFPDEEAVTNQAEFISSQTFESWIRMNARAKLEMRHKMLLARLGQ